MSAPNVLHLKKSFIAWILKGKLRAKYRKEDPIFCRTRLFLERNQKSEIGFRKT